MLELGEEIKDGVVREVKEETGIDAVPNLHNASSASHSTNHSFSSSRGLCRFCASERTRRAFMGGNTQCCISWTMHSFTTRTSVDPFCRFCFRSDLYFVCRLEPLSFDIKKQDSEIEECKWMPVRLLQLSAAS